MKNHTIDPAFAVVDKKTRFIRMGLDGCLAVFDTRKQAREVSRKHKGTEVVPVTVGRFVNARR
jgi:hypothetical protein